MEVVMLVYHNLNGHPEPVICFSLLCPEFECFNPEKKDGFWSCPKKECPSILKKRSSPSPWELTDQIKIQTGRYKR